MTIILILVFGFCGAGRSTIGYLYLLELIPKRHKILVGTLLHAINSLTLVFSSLYFWFITKNYFWFLLYSTIANFICTIAILFIPESPEYLYASKDYDGARDSFNKILKFNSENTIIT